MRFSQLAKLSGALILTTGLAGTASAQNYHTPQTNHSAHEACKSDESRSKVIGGGIGAVAGAVFGSQVAGSGARTEASVIGGVLGGLAGAGIADKRVDCDPIYNRNVYDGTGYQTSSSSGYTTAPTTTTYNSVPTYSTTQPSGYQQTANYPQVDYGTRTTVSDHPVYSDPTWGAQPARSYASQTVSQPVYSQPSYAEQSYSQPTYQQPIQSQPSYTTTTTRYVKTAPAVTYARPVTTTYVRPVTTTYVQPTTYAHPRRAERRRGWRSRGYHHHGKYSCSDRH